RFDTTCQIVFGQARTYGGGQRASVSIRVGGGGVPHAVKLPYEAPRLVASLRHAADRQPSNIFLACIALNASCVCASSRASRSVSVFAYNAASFSMFASHSLARSLSVVLMRLVVAGG